MPIACIADTVHVYSLANRLNDQRKDGVFCDVLLKISGQVLPTHSSVLSASSPFFRGLICGDRPTPPHLTSGAAPQEIEMELLGVVGPLVTGHEDWALEAVAGLVDYIYTGKISLRDDCLDLVVQLAEAFMLDGLSTLVKTYVESSAKDKREPSPRGTRSSSAATAKKNATNKVVTLPSVRRNRKMPPIKLRTAATTKAATKTKKPKTAVVGVAKPRVLRARKRPEPTAVSASDGEELSSGQDDDWTLHRKERKRAVASGGEAAGPPVVKKKKRKRYRFRCKQCDFVSLDLLAIRDHKLVHPNRTFECVACQFITGRSVKLLEHVMAAGHRETKCSLCSFEAADADSLLLHLQRHDHAKPYFCDCCEQRFTSPSLLALHVTKHTTERPFVCSICNHGFKLKNNLRKHMLTHTAEKNHMCDQCDFRTAYKGTLRMHLRIHSGEMLSCPHEGCNFQAYSKRHIAKHGLTHNKDKPYVCEVCGQKYAQIESLRRHSRVHNPDTKILHCELCQYTTQRMDKMREHSKKSHTGNPAEPGSGGVGGAVEGGGVGGGRIRRPPKQAEPRGAGGDPNRRPPRADVDNHAAARRLQGFIDQQQQQLQSRLDAHPALKKTPNFVPDHLHHHQQLIHQSPPPLPPPPPPRMDTYPSGSEGRWDPPTLLDPRAHHFPHHRDQSSLINFMATHGALL